MLRNTSEPRQKKNVRFFNESVSSGYSSTENEPFLMQNGGHVGSAAPRAMPQAPSTCSSSNTVLSNDGSFNDSVFTGMPVPTMAPGGGPMYAPAGYPHPGQNPQGSLSPPAPQNPHFSPPSFRSAPHPQNSLPTIQEMTPPGPSWTGPNSPSQFANQVNSLGLPLPQLRQSLPSPFFHSGGENQLRERWETWMELVNLHQPMLARLDEQTRFAKIIELSIVAVQMTGGSTTRSDPNQPVFGY